MQVSNSNRIKTSGYGYLNTKTMYNYHNVHFKKEGISINIEKGNVHIKKESKTDY